MKIILYIQFYINIYQKDNIFNQTFKNLFSEYLESKEFKNSIIKLKEEGNYFDYIKDYIDKAKDFVNYFSKSN